MKTPSRCVSLNEIRQAIDLIDSQIISLMGMRYEYVKEVVRYKEPTKEGILAKERFDNVISTRREMAEKAGLDPDVIEKVYRCLLEYFISEEHKLLKNK
jgi:isochorismate pyruvate lyase